MGVKVEPVEDIVEDVCKVGQTQADKAKGHTSVVRDGVQSKD